MREMMTEMFVCLFILLCLVIVIQFTEINHYKKRYAEIKKSTPINKVSSRNQILPVEDLTNFTKHALVKKYIDPTQRRKVASLLMSTFANQHVVFVGDSLTRYQYLSFVYALKMKESFPPFQSPSIAEQVQWGSWIQFYKSTNKLLAPYETCDCFRPKTIETPENVFENRYFHDPALNITVTYIQFFSYYAHGHWTPLNNFSLANPPMLTFINPSWQYYLKDLFPKHINTLSSKPTIAVLNVGLWPNKFYDEQYTIDVVNSILNSSSSNVKQLIWRTTTLKKADVALTKAQVRADSLMCSFPGVSCLNVSWTQQCKDLHVDYVHFKEPVYSAMNEQLALLVRSNAESSGSVSGSSDNGGSSSNKNSERKKNRDRERNLNRNMLRLRNL